LKRKKRICIITPSLSDGGAERVAAQQSILFLELGFDVYLITIINKISYPFVGELLNLGLDPSKKDTIKSKITRHCRIRSFIKNNNVDIIIDHRTRSSVFTETIFSHFSYSSKPVIYYVHSFLLTNYIPSKNFISKHLFSSAFKIVTVSKAIKQSLEDLYGFKNVVTLYNPIDVVTMEALTGQKEFKVSFEYVLFYGRLVDQIKNLKLLITAYSNSVLPENDIKLILLGEGKDKVMLKELTRRLNVSEMVLFKDFTANPFPIVKNAKYTLLTSRIEGFPMVILESLACGVPMIAVDCNSGPSEIIIDKFNGLLVENNNVKALSKAMNSFILDKKLYNHCKKNTKGSISAFENVGVAKQWANLLK